ncbi:MAG: hypothetical protein R6V12_04840 [Candidatus Hydrogenedentota bacterium]
MRIVDRGAKVVVVGNDWETAVVGKMLDEMLVAVRKGHLMISALPAAIIKWP